MEFPCIRVNNLKFVERKKCIFYLKYFFSPIPQTPLPGAAAKLPPPPPINAAASIHSCYIRTK
jgi:hypothetical protein